VKVDTAELLSRSNGSPVALKTVHLASAATIATIAWLLAWYGETFASMVAVWWRSETFAHGLLILPISAWLIWTKRRALAAVQPVTCAWGVAWLIALGVLWLLARVAEVLVVQQFALIAMVSAMVLALLGPQVVRVLAFPLAFLFLAVPFGEGLIPPMMEFTADFTVAALRLTGIPVFREGNFFTIPSGNWSVVEGCSGLRYLIASFAGGCLYAYLTYRSLARRLAFVAAAIAVPVVANWFRAYMIVMIGHISDMRLAHGVDHLIYGWVFFGAVMLLLMWAGSHWRQTADETEQNSTAEPSERHAVFLQRLLAAIAMAVVMAGVWPLYAAHVESLAGVGERVLLPVPRDLAGWQRDQEALTDWRPRFKGADASLFQVYRKGDARVALYLGLYRYQRQDAELINSQNIMVVQKHPVWSNVGETRPVERIGQFDVPLRESRLRSSHQRLLIWDWHVIDGRHLLNPYLGKILLTWEKLLGRRDDGVAILVATPSEEHTEAAEAVLRAFVGEMLPSIDAALAAAASVE
jgi:exosortase A